MILHAEHIIKTNQQYMFKLKADTRPRLDFGLMRALCGSGEGQRSEFARDGGVLNIDGEGHWVQFVGGKVKKKL